MASATTKLRDVLCAVFFVCTLFFSFTAESATCGVCNDSYLACVSSGGSSSSCDRQLRSCQSACYGSDAKSSEGGGFGAMILVLAIGLGAFLYLNSWMNEKKREKEIEEEKERRLKMTPEEIAKEQEEIERKKQFAETFALREVVLPKLQDMTVDEISAFTKSASRRSTVAWLSRNGYKCLDYDGGKKTK